LITGSVGPRQSIARLRADAKIWIAVVSELWIRALSREPCELYRRAHVAKLEIGFRHRGVIGRTVG